MVRLGATGTVADILAAYRRLGVPDVRRYRLGLESGTLSSAEPDLIAALSELVGHDCYPVWVPKIVLTAVTCCFAVRRIPA